MKLNAFIVNDNPMETLLYCFGGDGDSGGGGGGGSAGDFDDSYNDSMGYSSDGSDNDSQYGSGSGGYSDGSDYSSSYSPSPSAGDGGDNDSQYGAGAGGASDGSDGRPATDASGDPSEESTVDFGYDYSAPSTGTGSFLDSDNDGIPDTIDVDTRQPTTVDYGYDYPSAPVSTDYGYDYATPTTATGPYGADTSFSNIYDPFAGGDYGTGSPTGDSDDDGIPDYLDSDTTRPFSSYESWQAMPDYTFQKQLLKDPQAALKAFGAKSKKIDTLKNGQEVYTVTLGQKNPISGEVIDRSYVYTTGPDGETVKDLYNVTDENALSDAIGNALGFAVPLAVGIPVRASGDTKVMNKYTTTSNLYKEADVSKQYYGTSALTAFGKELSRTTTIETEAERTARLAREAAEQARDQGGDGGVSPIIIPRREEETTEPTTPGGYEEYFEQFMGSTPRYYSPYDVMRGRAPVQTAAVGGQINAPDDYLTVNSEYVKQMPDAFMRDPAMAKSAEEVKAIFAHNRRVQEIAGGKQAMSNGGQAVSQQNVAVVGESGAIGANPEEVTAAESVADNIEKTVPEGTFIINQPAAQQMGTADIKDMLMGAVKELRKQGVDFSFGEGKIPEEDAVSLLVSKGEIMVHPLLVSVIGLDRLKKINNRGEAEVKKRIEQNGQSPQAEQAQAVV